MRNIHWWWFAIAILLFVIVMGLSILVAPTVLTSLANLLLLAGVVAVGVVTVVAGTRAIVERKQGADVPPPNAGAQNTSTIGDGANVDQAIVGDNNTQKKIQADTYIETQIVNTGARQILDTRFSLPAKPEPFEGREDEVREVVRRLREGRGSLVSGLAGLGGVGKTAVAIVAAHEVAEEFPDGQIWLELRGTSDAPMPVSEVMAIVIRALEPNADLRNPSEAELAGMYRTALHGKRVLLGLDNARDAAQVQPLLVPPPAAVLVTARTGFTLAGLVPLRLDTLKKEDAEKLLVELCPRARGNAGELAELCGCLPLALRIAGRYLAEHEAVVVARYVAQVRERRLHSLKAEGERDLEAVFAETYDYLSDETQTRWRALGVFVASFTASAAGYVWGLDEPDGAQEILSELARLSIVEYDAESERFDLHDLLREFAGGRLPGGERRKAEVRYAVFFKNVASAADDLYEEGGENVVAGLKLFEQELMHIRAGQKWAAENWETDEEAARLCIEYPLGASNPVNLRLSAHEQIRWLEEAVKAAHTLGQRRLEGAALGSLGIAYHSLGEVRRAIGYYEEHLDIAREIGDRRGEGAALGSLGNAYRDLGEVRRAIGYYEQQLAIVREIGDRRGEGSALGNLGLAYADLGEVRRAIGYYEQALVIAREIGDRRGEGTALGNLGIAYKNLGEVRRAIGYYEQALVIDREIGDRRGEGAALGNLGNAYYSLGEVRRAIEFYEQHLAIASEIGDRRGEGNALTNMGLAYKELGDIERAKELWKGALEIYVAIEDPNAERVRGWLKG